MIIEIIKYSRIDKPEQFWYKVEMNNVYMSVFNNQEDAEKYAEMLFNNNGSEIINQETIKTYNNAS